MPTTRERQRAAPSGAYKRFGRKDKTLPQGEFTSPEDVKSIRGVHAEGGAFRGARHPRRAGVRGDRLLCEGVTESLRGVPFLVSEREPKENQGADTGDFIPLLSAPWTPGTVGRRYGSRWLAKPESCCSSYWSGSRTTPAIAPRHMIRQNLCVVAFSLVQTGRHQSLRLFLSFQPIASRNGRLIAAPTWSRPRKSYHSNQQAPVGAAISHPPSRTSLAGNRKTRRAVPAQGVRPACMPALHGRP